LRANSNIADPFTGKMWTPAEMLRSSAHRAAELAYKCADYGDWASAHGVLHDLIHELGSLAAQESFLYEDGS
jgi:hypothetical protein